MRCENDQFGSLKKCFFLNEIHFKLGHTLGQHIPHITPSDNQVLFILYILMYKFFNSFTYSALFTLVFYLWQVTVVDNFFTGRKRNIEHW